MESNVIVNHGGYRVNFSIVRSGRVERDLQGSCGEIVAKTVYAAVSSIDGVGYVDFRKGGSAVRGEGNLLELGNDVKVDVKKLSDVEKEHVDVSTVDFGFKVKDKLPDDREVFTGDTLQHVGTECDEVSKCGGLGLCEVVADVRNLQDGRGLRGSGDAAIEKSLFVRGKNWERNQEKKKKRRRNKFNRAVSKERLNTNWRQTVPVSVVGKKPLFEDCSDDIKSQLVTSRAEMYIARNKVETEKAERLAKELRFKRESRYDETELELKRQRNENSLRAALDKRFNGHEGSFARTLVDADLATTLGAPSLESAGSGDISPNSSISVAELNRMEKKMVDMSKQVVDLTLALETEKFTSKTLSERVERLVEFGPNGDSRRMNTFREELEAYPPLDSYSITTSQHEALADLDY